MRHRIRKIASIVFIAALLNLLVAWLIAWSVDDGQVAGERVAVVQQFTPDNTVWSAELRRGMLMLRARIDYRDVPFGAGVARVDSDDDIAVFASKLPAPMRREMLAWIGGLDDPQPSTPTLKIVAIGWPWAAFYYVDERTQDFFARQPGDNHVIRGALVARAASFAQTDPILLPYRPMWRGFWMNMLVHVPLVWLAFANVRVFHQWRRYRHGWCPVCSYDLRFDNSRGCPECGWRKPKE